MTLRSVRWALLSLLAAGVLFAGFPAATAESRWAVAVAVAFGMLGLASRGFGAAAAAFSSAVAGGAAALLGSAPLCPWSALIVLSFGSGFFFRELVAARPPAGPDPVARALAPLAALWILASAAAAVSARSVWALFRGLDLRIVNSRGMTDAEALAGNLGSLAAVLSGVVLYGVLRRLDSDSARRALQGVLAGAFASALAALLQARGWIGAPRAPFWKMAGRLQGLSSDPNALGVLVGLAIPAAVAGSLWSSHRVRWWVAAIVLGAGLAASGSRSGFLVAFGGSAIAVAAGRAEVAARNRGRSAVWLGAAAAAVLFAVVIASDRHAGALFSRLVSIFDRDVPLEFRASARPILWRGAGEAWRRNPVAGLGWNAFSWQLPNVSPAAGAAMDRYDNPGSFYVQMLAETGIVGLAIFLVFLWASARAIASSLRTVKREARSFLPVGAAGALAAFAAALFLGSHLLAAEVSCAAFVMLAQFRHPGSPSSRIRGAAWIGVAVAGAAWAISLARTAAPGDAFRYSDGIGFYAPEKSPEGEFRWAGTRSAIRLGAGDRRRLRVVFRSPSLATEKLRVSSEGAELFSGELERDRGVRLLLAAPANRPAIFLLESSGSFRPSAFGGSGDARELSIQVFSEP